jgi:hypothetical protein
VKKNKLDLTLSLGVNDTAYLNNVGSKRKLVERA